MKIVTHDSSFHTDDVFAVATLTLLVGEAEIQRSRAPEIQATADYVVDTGMKYDPANRRFDHHQSEGAGMRDNGIPYASFGLVWKEYGKELAGGDKEAELIDRELVQPIDAHDNGVAIAEYKFKDVREYTIGDFLNSFINSGDHEHIDTVFISVVAIAKDLLIRQISTAKKRVASKAKILALYDASLDKRLIILPEELIGWREVLAQTPDTLYVIYPRRDGKWSLRAVPDSSKPNYFALRKPLPLEWAGKTNEELQKITGVEDALFAHRGQFMATVKSQEGAMALAKSALDA
jgi:uncharacterized UPF0160 family protein